MRVVQTSYSRLTASLMSSTWVLPNAVEQTSPRPEFESVLINPGNSRAARGKRPGQSACLRGRLSKTMRLPSRDGEGAVFCCAIDHAKRASGN
jgi:hypothetical protein